MRRLRTGLIRAEVDVEVSDLLEELEDEVLLDEVKERGLTAPLVPPPEGLMDMIASEHREVHPWGPQWLCDEGVCGRLRQAIDPEVPR